MESIFLYNKETNYHRKSVFIVKSFNMTGKPAFALHSAHFEKHEKSHWTYSIVYTNEAISLVAMRNKRILIGPKKNTPLSNLTGVSLLVE